MCRILLILTAFLLFITPVFAKEPLAVAQGWNATLYVYEDKIEIVRKEKMLLFFANFTLGDKEIPISNISAINFKRAGDIVGGFIRFSSPGAGEIKNVNADENAIVFTKKQQDDFLEAKDTINNLINKLESN
jgi:hypothetical protein